MNCDLIELLSMEINNQNGALVLNVFTDSPYLIPYPTFILSNTNGDVLAQEQAILFWIKWRVYSQFTTTFRSIFLGFQFDH